MIKHMDKYAFLAGLLLIGACNNENIPAFEPTGTESDDGSSESDGEMDEPELACWQPGGYEPEDPALFQCVGQGGGELEYMVCRSLNCTAAAAGACDFDNAGNWMVDSAQAGPFTYPPTPPDTQPNARACCESDATALDLRDGCKVDCARGACNEVIETLKQSLDAHISSPPALCGSLTECYDRTKTSLETWIAYLEANYDECVNATVAGKTIFLTNPAVSPNAGALACGRIKLNCAIDETEDPYDLNQSCSTSDNQPLAAGDMILECALNGDVELAGPEGNAITPFTGTAVVRRESPCVGDSCWFSVDRLEIDADGFSGEGYIGRNMHASLAYPGFGLLNPKNNEGAVAHRMFGLNVTLDASTPEMSLQDVAFKMGNSDDAVFEVSASHFQIIDAYFAWPDHELVISSDLARCKCTNCPL